MFTEIREKFGLFIDNARIDGNIVNMLDETLKFVRKNMKISTYIDTQTGKRADRTEYPVIAIRELILNSLVHPLVDSGKLKLTIPDKSKSKNQQYYS